MTLKEVRQYLAQKIATLNDIAKKVNVPINNYDTFTKIINKSTFDIAVVGEFTSGKSTLINALLGIDILPSLLEPTTARITYITYSEAPKIILNMKDGNHNIREFDINFLKKLIAENKSEVESIESIEVMINNPLLEDGIRIIDTPGTNETDEQRVKITYNILPEADAVIYLTIHPVTSTNIQVLKEHIIDNKIKNLFFVLNKIDLIGDQLEIAVKDSKSWFIEEYNQPLTDFYPLSALDYLEGIETNNEDLINKSRFEHFKLSLINFLKSSKKYKNLQEQYSAIFEGVKIQLIELLNIKISGLQLPEESFKERKNILEEDLIKFKEQILELEKQLDREFDSITLRVEDSLNNLLNEIISTIDDSFSRGSGDIDLLLKDIKLAIKYKYEAWIERNEPIINEILSSIKEEVSLRTLQSFQGIGESIMKFTDPKIMINGRLNNASYIDQVMADDSKFEKYQVRSVVSTMIFLHFIGFSAFAPAAFLFYPHFKENRKKWFQKQKDKIKPEIISSVQKEFKSFRKERLHYIDNIKNELNFQIDSAVKDQSNRIKLQIDEIENERKEKKSDIENKIKDYYNALELIKEI